jgi:hypothetical protein
MGIEPQMLDTVRIFRMAEEPAPALVATPHEAQKTVLDQTLRSKRQGSILRAILQPYRPHCDARAIIARVNASSSARTMVVFPSEPPEI